MNPATPALPPPPARRRPAPLRTLHPILGLLAGALLIVQAALPADSPAPSAETLDRSIHRGIRFLLKSQNKDGSWGSARRTKDLNIFAPVPGAHQAFRCGVTALAVEALLRTHPTVEPPEVRQAVDRGSTWLLEHLPQLRRADPEAIYNVWGHGYGIQTLAALHQRATNHPAHQQRLREVIQGQIQLLDRYESVNGGWGYYDFNVGAKHPASDNTSFTTATVLIAFHDAQATGVEIPKRLLQRAIDSLNRQRKSDNSYLYGEYLKYQPMRGINRPAGSLGRSQACNLALKLWGDPHLPPAVFDEWLDRLVARNGWLDIGRKRPVPHEAWFQVAAYFFYYGHYYAARCIDQASPDRAPRYRQQLATLLLALQEKDGSWWDFPFYDYHQPYGTAYALMALQLCRPPPP